MNKQFRKGWWRTPMSDQKEIDATQKERFALIIKKIEFEWEGKGSWTAEEQTRLDELNKRLDILLGGSEERARMKATIAKLREDDGQ